MPFIPDDDLEPVFDRLILDDPEGGAQTEEPSWTDKARAAFSVDNSIGSLITREKGLPDVHFQGGGTYDPWSAMSDDEKLDENFTYEAAFAESDQELDALRAQISKEQKARAMQTGVSGTLMAIGAGIFSSSI